MWILGNQLSDAKSLTAISLPMLEWLGHAFNNLQSVHSVWYHQSQSGYLQEKKKENACYNFHIIVPILNNGKRPLTYINRTCTCWVSICHFLFLLFGLMFIFTWLHSLHYVCNMPLVITINVRLQRVNVNVIVLW